MAADERVDIGTNLSPIETLEILPAPKRRRLAFGRDFSTLANTSKHSRQGFPSREQLERVEQYAFFANDPQRPLCRGCASLNFCDLISPEGSSHESEGRLLHKEFDVPLGCPLCSIIWPALVNYLDAQYTSGTSTLFPWSCISTDWSGNHIESRDERLAALDSEPVRLFLNPLCLHQRGMDHGTLPYQICELSAWSSTPEVLEVIELQEDWHTKEYSYQAPRLSLGWNMLSYSPSDEDDQAMLDRSLVRITFMPKTSWSDPLSGVVRYKSVLPEPNSLEATNLITGWIENCTTSHELCRSPQTNTLPTRLIDVGDQTCKSARLVKTNTERWTQEFGEEAVRYIALSYCWGTQDKTQDVPDFATTESTIKAHERALPIRLLPKTIVDAITFSRNLGVRFLWADSLCIIQGSSEVARQDWARESLMMAIVYGGAWLTIAASSGSSMHDGIFRPRSLEDDNNPEIGLKSLEDVARRGVVKLVPKHGPPVDSMDEPLYQRGWALQERVLSRRVLICNRDQFVWECQCDCFTESGFKMKSIGAMRLDHEFLKSMESDTCAVRHMWQCMVTDYCSKSITNPFDKLPAIGGLAKQLQKFHPEGLYIAGLWKDSLLDDLLWVHKDIDYCESRVQRGWQKLARNKPQGYRAPSWSWASIDGGVRWLFSNENGTGKYHAELMDYDVTPRDDDIFGQLIGAYITLKAPLWKMCPVFRNMLLNPESYSKFSDKSHDFDRTGLRMWKDWLRQDIHMEGRSLMEILGKTKADNTDFFLLEIRDNISLILSSPKTKELSPEDPDFVPRCYERIGVHGPTNSFETRQDWIRYITPSYEDTICRII